MSEEKGREFVAIASRKSSGAQLELCILHIINKLSNYMGCAQAWPVCVQFLIKGKSHFKKFRIAGVNVFFYLPVGVCSYEWTRWLGLATALKPPRVGGSDPNLRAHQVCIQASTLLGFSWRKKDNNKTRKNIDDRLLPLWQIMCVSLER